MPIISPLTSTGIMQTTGIKGDIILGPVPFGALPTGLVFYQNQRTVATSYVWDASGFDYVLLCQATGGIIGSTGTLQITLPVPTGPVSGRVCIIKDIYGTGTASGGRSGLGSIWIYPNGLENIEGLPTACQINAPFGKITLQSDGTNWWKE